MNLHLNGRRGAVEPGTCDSPYDATEYWSKFSTFYFHNIDKPREDTPLLFVKIAALGVLLVTAADWFVRRGLWADICPYFHAKPRFTVRTSLATFCISYVYMDLTSGTLRCKIWKVLLKAARGRSTAAPGNFA